MKKVFLLAMALVCAVSLATSCNKEVEEEDLVTFIGDWKYSGMEGSGVDDVDIFKNYLFKIDSGQIWIFGMDETTLTAILSYTRDGNKVTFTPSFNGKYSSAVLHKIYGTGTESISWDCGNGQVYLFSKR